MVINILLKQNFTPLIFDFGHSFVAKVTAESQKIPLYNILHMRDILVFINEIGTKGILRVTSLSREAGQIMPFSTIQSSIWIG